MPLEIWKDLRGAVIDGRFRLETLTYSGRNQAEFDAIAGEPATVTLLAAPPEEMEQLHADLLHASRLEHPNLLRIIGAGHWSAKGVPLLYVATERPDETLADLLRAGPLPPARTRALLLDLIAALTYVHDQGLVYRSLEPQTTVRVGTQWKLADRGQLCPIGAADAAIPASPHTPPEAGTQCALPSWDVWTLGALLRDVIGQAGADLEKAPFEAIMQGCLDPAPARRPALEQIRTTLAAAESSDGLQVKAADPAADAVAHRDTAELARAGASDTLEQPIPGAATAEQVWRPAHSASHAGRYLALIALTTGGLALLPLLWHARRSEAGAPSAAGASDRSAPPQTGSQAASRMPDPPARETKPKAMAASQGDLPPAQILRQEQTPRPSETPVESRVHAGAPPQVGIADYIASSMDGQLTASGEPFNSRTLTAAHPRYALGTRLRVTNLENQRSVVVRVNDRGKFSRGRVIHLTLRAARDLGITRKGSARVRIEQMGSPHQ